MKMMNLLRGLLVVLLAFQIQLVQAQAIEAATPSDEVVLTKDRFEGFNRGAYKFNDVFDRAAFKPIAKAYQKVVPAGTRGCVHGVFENLNLPYTAVNNILQGKFKAAGQDICRFVVNSTVGLGGCFDVASKLNIPKHDEDFGQTLGVWGVPAGSFIMLPGLGPSNVRDALAKPVDFLADPIGYLKIIKLRNVMRGTKFVDSRTTLLETTELTDEIALDKYTLLRDAWMQNRESQVRDEDYEPDVAPLASAVEPVVVVEDAAKVVETAVIEPPVLFTPVK